MMSNKKKMNELWEEFKKTDVFHLVNKMEPYDQQELCFKAGFEAAEQEFIMLRKEDWENIKKRL